MVDPRFLEKGLTYYLNRTGGERATPPPLNSPLLVHNIVVLLESVFMVLSRCWSVWTHHIVDMILLDYTRLVCFRCLSTYHNYRPQRSCGQGNIFTPVCHSFCSQGGLPQCMLGYHHHHPPPDQTSPWDETPRDQTPPQTRHAPPYQIPPWDQPPRTRHPPGTRPPREADSSRRSTSGRYASYWNAFFFTEKFCWEYA